MQARKKIRRNPKTRNKSAIRQGRRYKISTKFKSRKLHEKYIFKMFATGRHGPKTTRALEDFLSSIPD
jgi:hypothetical protein